jgi:TonB family protein
MASAPTNPRRRRQGEPSWGRLAAAVAISVGGHALLLFNLVVLGLIALAFPPVRPVPRPTAVGMVRLPASQWTGNRATKAPGTQKSENPQAKTENQPEPPKPRAEPEKAPGKVVDIQGNGQVPDEARFAAERNSKVAKETVSRLSTPDYRNAMPHPTTTVPDKTPSGEPGAQRLMSGNDGQADDTKPFKPKDVKQDLEMPDVKARDRLALQFDPYSMIANREATDAIHGNSKRFLIQPGGANGGTEDAEGSLGKKGRGDKLVTLVPSEALLDKITGAPAADLTPLDNVDEGNETFLNAREWKYASFFNRVKQNVGMVWDPTTALRRRDPSGQVYAYRDRYTIVSVILNPEGSLKDIYVEKSCGVDFLDEEAVAAFQRASPFPNPPVALVDPQRNEIRFNFGFYLEVSAHPALRVFRSGN